MTEDQANDFASKWKVVDQYRDASGVSATVFEEIGSGKRYLAIRGTESVGDINADYILALGFPSYLNPQFLRLHAQVQAWLDNGTLSNGFSITGHSLGGYLAAAVGTWFRSQAGETYLYNAPGVGGLVGNVLDAFRAAFGLGGTALVSGITNVRGTAGLSAIAGLGAQLAPPVFIETEGNLDPTANHSIVGLADSLAIHDLFARLSPTVSIETVTNILKAASHTRNTATTAGKTLENALDAVRSFIADYRQGTANASVTPTIPGNRDDFYANLLNLQRDIENLSFYNPATQSLGFTVESLVGQDTAALFNSAQTDLATRYALYKLNPFAVRNATDLYSAIDNGSGALDVYNPATGTGSLTEQYFKDRSAFLVNKLWSGTNDQTTVSGDALALRNSGKQYFDDRATGYRLYLGEDRFASDVPKASLNQIVFGRETSDTLTGGSRWDKLYGMSGNDTLQGGKGNDYLEGGQGTDTYVFTSGDGLDTILDTDRRGQILYDGGKLSGGAKIGDNLWQSADGRYTYSLSGGPGDLPALHIVGPGGTLWVKDFASGMLGITLAEAASIPVPSGSVSFAGGAAGSFLASWWTAGWQAPSQFQGLAAADAFAGGNADDLIAGAGGADWLLGNGGKDRLEGGEGNDYLLAGLGADRVYAGEGNDFVSSNQGFAFSATQIAGAPLSPADERAWVERLWRDVGARFAWQPAGLQTTGQGYLEYGYGLAFGGAYSGVSSSGLAFTYDPAAYTVDYRDSSGNLVQRFALTLESFLESDGADELIDGGEGDDLLIGDAGTDAIQGGEGNDILAGNDGADTLLGGTGDDLLLGGAADDYLEGGSEADRLYGETGDDTLLGGAGDDALDGDSDSPQLFASHGDDILEGGAGNDELLGRGGADILDGGPGDDTLLGDDESIPAAYQAADFIDGGDGNDLLAGFGGDDALYGGAGADELQGGAGDDYLAGEAGADRLFGEAGDDTLAGGAGFDILVGAEGDDTLDGGAGADVLLGGAGDDVYLLAASEGRDSLTDEEGHNRIVFAPGIAPQDLTASLWQESARPPALNLKLDGADLVTLNRGIDTFGFQFAGGPLLSYSELLDLTLRDPVTLSGTEGADELYGGAGEDWLSGRGGDDRLSGASGNDRLEGGYGDDVLSGGPGNDVLDAGPGNDTLSGGQGNDTLQGGAGDDVYRFGRGDGQDTIEEGGYAADQDSVIFSPELQREDVAFKRLPNKDLEISIPGTGDTLTAKNWYGDPSARVERFVFADGIVIEAPSLLGLAAEPILGTGAGERLAGTEHDDRLEALAGDDVLDGGAGDDRLAGGAGADTYRFGYGSGQDRVIEEPGEASAIELQGPRFDDLAAVRQGDDLVLGLKGAQDTLTLEGYFALPHAWRLRSADGTERPLAEVVAENEARQSALAPVARLKEAFLARTRAEIVSPWIAQGYREKEPGVFEQLPEARVSYSSESIDRAPGYFGPVPPSSPFLSAYVTEVRKVGRFEINELQSDAPEIIGVSPYELSYGPRQSRELALSWAPPQIIRTSEKHYDFQVTYRYEQLTDQEIQQILAANPGISGVQRTRSYSVTTQSLAYTITHTRIEATAEGAGIAAPSPSSAPLNGAASVAAILAGDPLPASVQADFQDITETRRINVIEAGAGDNRVSLEGLGVVEAGAGDDRINFTDRSVTGFQPDYLFGWEGLFLAGGAGDDFLGGSRGSDLLLGGEGSDVLEGGGGADEYYVFADEEGVDLILDQGAAAQFYGGREHYYSAEDLPSHYNEDFLFYDWYYNSIGLSDWREREFRGEALPPLPATNDFATWSKLPEEDASGAHLLSPDTVVFGEGIRLSDLKLSWGETVLEVWKYATLDLSWGEGKGVRVVIPRAEDTLGSGIERLRFADGTIKTLQEMVALAPSAPDFDFHQVRGSPGADFLAGRRNDESFYGGAGDDVLYGVQGNDVLYGEAGDDLLYGGGDDYYAPRVIFRQEAPWPLWSDTGNDWLYGGEGNDLLDGGDGNDFLEGGPGNDALAGGPGADCFRFGADAGGSDTITDFAPGEHDVLDFTGALSGPSTAPEAYLQFSAEGNDTLIRVDPRGEGEFGAPALSITLKNAGPLDLAAFVSEGNLVTGPLGQRASTPPSPPAQTLPPSPPPAPSVDTESGAPAAEGSGPDAGSAPAGEPGSGEPATPKPSVSAPPPALSADQAAAASAPTLAPAAAPLPASPAPHLREQAPAPAHTSSLQAPAASAAANPLALLYAGSGTRRYDFLAALEALERNTPVAAASARAAAPYAERWEALHAWLDGIFAAEAPQSADQIVLANPFAALLERGAPIAPPSGPEGMRISLADSGALRLRPFTGLSEGFAPLQA